MSKMIDMTGWIMKDHGVPDSRLTVINRAENTSEGRAQWNCLCECGNSLIVLGKNLRNGNTKSCGCLSKEKASQRMYAKYQQEANQKIIGKKFGKLTVIKDSGLRSPQGHIIFECQCECGNICYRIGSNLLSNEKRPEYIPSCGCLNSAGEAKIIKILNQNNIVFEQQKTFESCIFTDTQTKARFDFYIPNPGYIIEYDGKQHFICSNEGWNTQEKFNKTQEHDNFKNQWCKEHDIPIIRIPYTKFATLNLKDLILETSQFILTKED